MGDKPNGKIKGRSYWTGKQRTWADEGGYSSDADGGGNGSMRCLRRPCGGRGEADAGNVRQAAGGNDGLP